ncbi:MAG: DUF998 domain-containing protein [Actinomycetota bacterium]|nr:DUF998 domain-containing protein [Actinomycetota bacterium]
MQEFFRVGEYKPIAETVSALEAGPYGWVQQVNFAVFGVLTIAFAVGLHLGMHPTRASVAGPAIIAWTGVVLVLAAIFPLREDAYGVTYDPTGLHFVNGLVFFLSIGLGLVVVSKRDGERPEVAQSRRLRARDGYRHVRRDPRSRGARRRAASHMGRPGTAYGARRLVPLHPRPRAQALAGGERGRPNPLTSTETGSWRRSTASWAPASPVDEECDGRDESGRLHA